MRHLTSLWVDSPCVKRKEALGFDLNDSDAPFCEEGDVGSDTFTADLTEGVFHFSFGDKDVTLKRSSLSSDESVFFDRPTDDGGAEVRCPIEAPLGSSAETWDDVFCICAELLSKPPETTIGTDDWPIGTTPGNIFLTLKDIRVNDPIFGAADIKLELRGDRDEPFPPLNPGDMSTFHLTHYQITGRSVGGGSGGSMGCRPRGSGTPDEFLQLFDESLLMITAPSP